MFNQTVTTFPISKDKVAAYLFYNNSPLVIKKEKQIRTCLIGTNTQIEFYSAQDARYDVVSCEEIESFYPATLEDRVKKIMMLLKKMTPSFGRSIKLSGAELVSCFFMQRYAENGNRLSQNALNSQCSAIYSYLSSRKYIKNSIMNNVNYITVLAEGMAFVEELEKEETTQKNADGKKDNEIIYTITIESQFLANKIKELIKEKSTEDAIGKAKELIESCCRTIMDEKGEAWDKDWSIHELTAETMEALGIRAKDVQGSDDISKSTKALLSNIAQISQRVGELRNIAGSGHGRPENFRSVDHKYAELAVGASIVLVQFLWATHLENRAEQNI